MSSGTEEIGSRNDGCGQINEEWAETHGTV